MSKYVGLTKKLYAGKSPLEKAGLSIFGDAYDLDVNQFIGVARVGFKHEHRVILDSMTLPRLEKELRRAITAKDAKFFRALAHHIEVRGKTPGQFDAKTAWIYAALFREVDLPGDHRIVEKHRRPKGQVAYTVQVHGDKKFYQLFQMFRDSSFYDPMVSDQTFRNALRSDGVQYDTGKSRKNSAQ